MSVALLLTTDGRRECIEQTIPSLLEMVKGIDGPRLIFDDSGDHTYRNWLRRFDGFEVIGSGPRRGQARALRRAWRHMLSVDCEWILHAEDDFLFERPVDVGDLVGLLRDRPYLAQVALLRQPWFPSEIRAGGVIERDPDEYELVVDGGRRWIEHRMWFTLNPCLYRRSLCERERPNGAKHEWRFSRQLCQDPEVRFAYWGDGTPWIQHFGPRR